MNEKQKIIAFSISCAMLVLFTWAVCTSNGVTAAQRKTINNLEWYTKFDRVIHEGHEAMAACLAEIKYTKKQGDFCRAACPKIRVVNDMLKDAPPEMNRNTVGTLEVCK